MKVSHLVFSVLASISIYSVAFAGAKSVEVTKNESLISAASVDTVQFISGQNVDAKIFSVSGGDPAMNGA